MKKTILKGCLIVFGFIVLLMGIIAGSFSWSMHQKRINAERDKEIYDAECNKTSIVTEEIFLEFDNFKESEIGKVKFFLVRNKKIVKDTLVRPQKSDHKTYLHAIIPFRKFRKTDSIMVKTDGGQTYTISGFSFYASLHYGMFGYVGSHDCRLSESFLVNGKKSSGILDRNEAEKDNAILRNR